MNKSARKSTQKLASKFRPRLFTHGLKKTLDYVCNISVFSMVTAD